MGDGTVLNWIVLYVFDIIICAASEHGDHNAAPVQLGDGTVLNWTVLYVFDYIICSSEHDEHSTAPVWLGGWWVPNPLLRRRVQGGHPQHLEGPVQQHQVNILRNQRENRPIKRSKKLSSLEKVWIS